MAQMSQVAGINTLMERNFSLARTSQHQLSLSAPVLIQAPDLNMFARVILILFPRQEGT